MKVLTDIKQIGEDRWLQLLAKSPYASPFQTPQMYAVCQQTNLMGSELVAVESDGELKALVLVVIHYEPGIKAYFSKRGIVYGGPLLRSSDESRALQMILAALSLRCQQRLIYLEVRNGFDYSAFNAIYAQAEWRYKPWLNYQFKALSPESFQQHMAKSRQRQLNKALREGVTWRVADTTKDVHVFYALLSDLYHHKIKKPLPSYDYFFHLYQSSIAQLIVVELSGEIIGGVLCPYLAGAFMYEYYICGRDHDYPHCAPSTVALWAMVNVAKEMGVQNLDLMGAGEPNKANSVRTYKRKFGGELVEHGRYILVFKPRLYRLGQWVINMLKRK